MPEFYRLSLFPSELSASSAEILQKGLLLNLKKAFNFKIIK